jgi:GNAT superfamily N-acetyltransferase
MQKTHRWARVVCRPALPKDTADMLMLTSHIWDGHDYLPEVWADWLADPDGFLAVAEYGGQVVGIYMLERFGQLEWYLAGLRVHPEMEGKGIASHLHEYVLDYWQKQHWSGLIRLATLNPKVKTLCDRTGFHQIGEFTAFVAPVLPEPVDSFSLLAENQVDSALEMALHSPIFDWQNRVFGHGWWWSDPQAVYIEDAIKESRAWSWRGETGVLVICVEVEGDRSTPVIEVVGCAQAELPALLLDYRRLAAQQGYMQAGWVASLIPELHPILTTAGFIRDWDEAVSLYERRSE